MLRIALALFYVALSTPALAQITGSLPPATPSLKREISVASDLVRIGDLIDNAGERARVPIFRSPDLGQTGTVSAERVIEAVRAHGFTVVETSGVSEVAVTRLSRLISVKDLEAQIAAALAGQSGLGEAKDISVVIERDARPLHLESSLPAELKPTRVFYDPRSARFDVTFEAPGSVAARRLPLRYVGTAIETREAAMLMRPLNRSEVVKASDIVIERRPKAELRNDVVSTSEAAVGLAARRPLAAGEPLRPGDLMKPELVQRNEAVTLVYQAPGLVLTIRGKALESGAQGDAINVLNLQSKRTLQGTVSGAGEVTIAAIMPRAAAQGSAAPSQPAADPPRSE